MDRDLSPTVTYWTGTWDPGKEAISKEVVALRIGTRTKSPVVSFSPGQRSGIDVDRRVVRLSHRRWLTLRALAALIEPQGKVSHVFGGQSSWHLLRALGRRPILLTAVSAGPTPGCRPPADISMVVVEAESAIQEWIELGVSPDRLRVVHPGVDLEWYRYAPPPRTERTTLLFASTPDNVTEFEARGIPLLADLARLRPDLDIILPWRNWGNLPAAKRAIADLRPPANLIVQYGDVPDMRAVYAGVHATVACFAPGAGKLWPNSIIEGLACGRPTIVTEGSAIAQTVERTGVGAVTTRTPDGIGLAVDRLQLDWSGYSERARRTAESLFDVVRFVRDYDRLYRALARA